MANTDTLHNVLASQVKPGPNRTVSILVVDDEPVNLALLEEILSVEGYEPILATNASLARQLAKERLPQLILLDIMMPDEDGLEMLAKLKKDNRTSLIPVIFLTAATDITKKLTGFRLGAVDYIVKPFHPEEILARIALHLKLNRAHQLLITSQSSQMGNITPPPVQPDIHPQDLPKANFQVFQHRVQTHGRDYFDVLQTAEQIFTFFVADITCKKDLTPNICAALTTLRQQYNSPIYSPLDIMTMINGVLYEIMRGKNAHITACLLSLNRDTMQINVCNGAHPPILNIPVQGIPYFLECRGDVMGTFPEVCFEMRSQKVTAGDRLLLYSDGLVERASRRQSWANELWHLQEAAAGIKNSPLAETPERFVRSLTHPEARCDTDTMVLAIDV